MLAELITFAAFVAQAASGSGAVGRTEIILRDADVVFSRGTPLECVVSVRFGESLLGGRFDAAMIELTLDVEGETTSFVPFVLVAEAVVLDPRIGEYRPIESVLAREPVQRPGVGQRIRMMATGVVRYWAAGGGDPYLRIYADDPVMSERPADSIRLVNAAGSLGKIVVLAR